MRTLGIATVLALTLGMGGVTSAQYALADDTTVPSHQDVQDAEHAAQAKATDVESVRAQLVLANQRLQTSGKSVV